MIVYNEAQRPSGPAAQRPSGPAAQRPSGPAAQRPSGPAAQRPSGPAAQRPQRPYPCQSRHSRRWSGRTGCGVDPQEAWPRASLAGGNANDRAGGRLAGDTTDGFLVDAGADFFCSSYDVAFQICEELGVPLARSEMKLGWHRNGRWATTTPGLSVANLIRNLPAPGLWACCRRGPFGPPTDCSAAFSRQAAQLHFSSDGNLAELDGDETFGAYLDRIGTPEPMKVSLKGFLEMTMGHVELSGHAYMRTYLAEMLLNADRLRVPEEGAASLASALADACGDAVRVSTAVSRVEVRQGSVTRGHDRRRSPSRRTRSSAQYPPRRCRR